MMTRLPALLLLALCGCASVEVEQPPTPPGYESRSRSEVTLEEPKPMALQWFSTTNTQVYEVWRMESNQWHSFGIYDGTNGSMQIMHPPGNYTVGTDWK